MTRTSGRRPVVDVDFSLAIHNRTGKYFIGRDVLALAGHGLGSVYYGSVPLSGPPSGLHGRILGRAQRWQVMSRTGERVLKWPRRPRGARPLLHLDAFTVPTAALRRSDAVLCHDVGPLTHPELFEQPVCRAYSAIFDEIAQIGPHVVFVSNASRDAFHDLYPGSRPSSSRTIYPALRVELNSDHGSPVPGLTGPFLLTVGSIGARKNQARCIAAFARSGLASEGVKYVICGGREPGFDEVRRSGIDTPGVILLPYVPDNQLNWLYNNAEGFVLVSLLEGFGIPVAEAVAHDLVPIVTRSGVLDEVAGPGALQVNPSAESEIADAMIELVHSDPAARRARLTLLRESVRRFTVGRFEHEWRSLFDDLSA